MLAILTASGRNARRWPTQHRGALAGSSRRGYVLSTFGPVGLFLVVAVVFPLVPLVLSRFLAPHRPNPTKLEPYESGMVTIGPTHVQFPIRYYLYALMFVIFDVEIIYLFPWALVYDKLPLVAAAEMAVFIILLLVGLAYAWRKRAFEWQ
jgi:NADH-quinone oxidoreductase subunit A